MQLSSFRYLEQEGFSGINAFLGISLYEYGLVWKCTDRKRREYLFVYGVQVEESGNHVLFDFVYMTREEYKRLLAEPWFSRRGVESFIGGKLLVKNFPNDIHSLLQYYGYANILGSSYNPFKVVRE